MEIPAKVRRDILEEEIKKFENIVKDFKSLFIKHLEKSEQKSKVIEKNFDETMASISFHKSFLESYIETGSEKDWDNAMLVLGDLIRGPLHRLENEALRLEDKDLHRIIVDFESKIFEYQAVLNRCLKEIVGVMKAAIRSLKDE